MFHESLHATIQFINLHQQWSLLIVFLIAFTESLPLLGTLIPGSVTMTAVGSLVGAAILPGTETISAAIVGAFAGDLLGYGIGVHYDQHIRQMWPFKTHPKWLAVGEDFFKKHGGKSIIIGRFIGPVRSTIPLIAGFMRFKIIPFLCAAIPSAILWAILYILPGFLLGALSLELPPGKASQFILGGVAIIIVVWFIFWSMQRFLKFIGKYSEHFIKIIWTQFQSKPHLNHVLNLISNKTHPEDHLQLMRLSLALLCLLLFIIVVINVATLGPLTHLNKPIFHLLQSFHTPRLNAFFTIITLLADVRVMLGTAFILGLYLLVAKQLKAGWYLWWIAGLSSMMGFIFKTILPYPRPTGLMVIEHGSSFPGAHVLISVCVLGFIAFTIGHQYKKIWYWIPYTITAIILLLIGLSRLYLGAHWLSDVIASYLLGSTLLLLTIIVYTHNQNQDAHISPFWPLIVSGVLLSLWCGYSIKAFNPTLTAFRPLYPEIHVSPQQWWNNPTHYLPAYRLNRFGKAIVPFNVQWMGSLNSIKISLEKQGWHELQRKIDLRNLLRRLSTNDPEQHTPLLSPLYHNERPTLFMVKRLDHSESIIELRLWQANIEFANSNMALWLGIADYHTPLPKLLSDPERAFFLTYQDQDVIHYLSPALRGDWSWKVLYIARPRHNRQLDSLHWKGSLLVVRPK